jgi:hypothetical protein
MVLMFHKSAISPITETESMEKLRPNILGMKGRESRHQLQIKMNFSQSWIVHEAIPRVLKCFGDKSCEDSRAVARKSGDVFRLQPLAAVPIPTSVSMNIVAAVSTGDLNDGIMIGE